MKLDPDERLNGDFKAANRQRISVSLDQPASVTLRHDDVTGLRKTVTT
jgi:hypothetical protein